MANQLSYKDLNKKLEALLDKLQSSDLDIDEAFKAYEEGMKIAKQIEDYLKTAENKIIKIKKQFDKPTK